MPISSPTDISNCELYLDVDAAAFSDAGSTPCAVGDLIQQLSDLSGNGRHATQATSGSRPTYTQLEGVGAARFLSTYLDTGSFIDSSWDTAITAVVVHQPKQAHSFAIFSTDASDKFRQYISASANVEATDLFSPNLSDNGLEETVSRQSMRVEILRYDGSTKKLRVAGPDADTSTSEAATGNLGMGASWRIGDYGLGTGFSYPGFIRAVVLYKRALTDGEVDDLAAWAIAKFFAHSDGPLSSGAGDANVVCDGNSITHGTGANTPYPTQLATLLGSGWTVNNQGVSSIKIGDMVADTFRTLGTIDGLWDGSASQNICVFFEGTNDISGGASGEQCFQRHKEYGLLRKAKGYQVIVATVIPQDGATADQQAARDTLNTLLRANWSDFADALADVAAEPEFDEQSDATNATYYDDGTHPTTAGYAIIAQVVQAAIQSLPVAGAGGLGLLGPGLCGANPLISFGGLVS